VTQASGYAVTLDTKNAAPESHVQSRIWGNSRGMDGATLRTEIDGIIYKQLSFEPYFGMSADGTQLVYSAIVRETGIDALDSLYRNGIPLAAEGQTVASLTAPQMYWRTTSRASITGDGTPFWLGGIADAPTAVTQNRGLFSMDGSNQIVVFLGGQSVQGLPVDLDTKNTVSPNFAFSNLGTHLLAEVQMATGNPDDDHAIIMDGAGLLVDGVLVREGNAVEALGALPGERWVDFEYMGATEGGSWFLTATTDALAEEDAVVVVDGVIAFREANFIDGDELSGHIEAAGMNEAGDIALIWSVDGGETEVLIAGESIILREGDEVDLDGDGSVDPGVVLRNFVGLGNLGITTRNVDDQIKVYFVATVEDIQAEIETTALFVCAADGTVIEPCPADFNGDGVLNILDFVAFQLAFNDGDLAADFNGDGVLNVLDFVAFQQAFQAGCN
jgi:hypothetical protein